MQRLTLEEVRVPDYQKVVFAEDSSTGLQAYIAVHNTNRGPSCGGIRMLPYGSQKEALDDVLRLAKGMSYKSALANIGFGGGKSVIIGDPEKKTPALFHSFGRAVEQLGGLYIAAKDMNISSQDLKEVRTVTKHVLGMEGVPGSSGDPSPVTAHGILRAMEATAEELTGTRSLKGFKVAIQGIGYVGFAIGEMIAQAGGSLWVTDIDPKALERAKKELGATVVGLNEIHEVPCDIFSPCARGAILNARSIPQLRCRAVVGCANNQLETEADGFRLHERGILYAPDYAINSGGIINIFIELDGYDPKKALAKADGIYDTVKEIFKRARIEKTAPFVVADKLAEERLYGKGKRA